MRPLVISIIDWATNFEMVLFHMLVDPVYIEDKKRAMEPQEAIPTIQRIISLTSIGPIGLQPQQKQALWE